MIKIKIRSIWHALVYVAWAVLSYVLVQSALAQNTNLPPVPGTQGSFFETATLYFSSFNTNAEMGWVHKGELSTGILTIQGPVNLADDLRLSYELGKKIGVESSTRSTGIAGTWLSQGIGPNLNFKLYDAKLQPYAEGGYNFHQEKFYGEIGLRVLKKMTRFTHAGVGMGAQLPSGDKLFTAFAGFEF